MTIPMERVSAARAAEMRSQLVTWRDPEEVRALLKEMEKPHGFYAASQGNMQFWREAHCACQFAAAQEAEALRLCTGHRPDFELRFGRGVVPCELAEIRDPGSRFSEELDLAAERHNCGEPQPSEPFDVDGHRFWLKERLQTAIERKAGKGYDPDTVLAVYVHAWIFPDLWERTARAIGETATPHAHKFAAIWVLVSGRLYCIDVKESHWLE